VFRALPGLGDALCAVPALRALRTRFPDARVTYAGLGRTAWLRTRFPDLVDRHWELPGLPGLHPQPARPGAAAAAFRSLAREGFDQALQLHGDGTRSNRSALAAGARWTLGPGWVVERGGDPPPPADLDGRHEIDRLLSVLEPLGVRPGRQVAFPVTDDDHVGAAALLGRTAAGSRRPYVVIHPGASDEAGRWPLDGFAAVARRLSRRHRVVVTGSRDEWTLGSRLRTDVPDAIDLTGRTDLGTLAGVLQGAAAVITNVSGPAHLAAATGAPGVVVFCGGDVRRWGPLDRDRLRVVRIPRPEPPHRPAATDADVAAVASAAVDVIARSSR
jgi:ADP-heptose:LPS heptosyltransferase